jgi:NTE family protein
VAYPRVVAAKQGPDEVVGLVLAGGGARGAYELGALSVLMPYLEERGERPRVIVGTSVGALNAALLASTANLPAERALREGVDMWKATRFKDVLRPIVSFGTLARVFRYLGQFVGLRCARLESLLNPAPMRTTVHERLSVEQLERNLEDCRLHAAAVVATSAATSRSVVFHRGGRPPEHDEKRGIDYVETPLSEDQVLASAAMPAAFPAVHVSSPDRARGWYYDGGTRLNTPIKPALELGAKRIVVVALHSIAAAPRQLADEHRPDAFEGGGQIFHAVLVDPLVNDLATLIMVNELVSGSASGDKQPIPYIFVAPRRRDAIGERAQEVFKDHYGRLRDLFRLRSLALLGRSVAGGRDPMHGELLSYFLFAPEFAEALIELGREDAQHWLSQPHEDGPWELGPLGLG